MNAPCAVCGELVPLEARYCPECGADPGAQSVTCPLCEGEMVRTIGHIQPGNRGAGPWDEEDIPCGCEDGRIEAPFIVAREAALSRGMPTA